MICPVCKHDKFFKIRVSLYMGYNYYFYVCRKCGTMNGLNEVKYDDFNCKISILEKEVKKMEKDNISRSEIMKVELKIQKLEEKKEEVYNVMENKKSP